MLGSVTGGAVHLSQANPKHLVICEGIETGLALLLGCYQSPLIYGRPFQPYKNAK
ncbi:hypothetical protein ABID39_001597 [Bartonella japonica]|uniref:Uncharacterized protein n=1 Tax=Bartonella japonica TaxID=357761 RepID=A0ABV2FQP5_9HYPH